MFNCRRLNPCGLKRCTGIGTPCITLGLLQTRGTSHRTKYGTGLPHLLRRTRSFAQRTVAETPVEVAPPADSCFYLGPGIDHPSDSLRMLTGANKVMETRDVTWEATLSTEAPSPRLP